MIGIARQFTEMAEFIVRPNPNDRWRIPVPINRMTKMPTYFA